jgi:cellulose synthase (UDP-forming)
LFHLHPIFSDVSVLMAYLLPFLVLLPLTSSVLLPGWPRLLWSTVYETTVCFPLFRSMFDLLLPKKLGFKVTPKGLTTHCRSFDWRSSVSLLAVTAITLAAMAKGLWEFWFFGIEKDAYFFNLTWAGVNLIGLVTGLLMAWERPQRRGNERIHKQLPVQMRGEGWIVDGRTDEVSLTGFSLSPPPDTRLPSIVQVTFPTVAPFPCQARVIYHERLAGHRTRCGLALIEPAPEFRRRMLLAVFADPATWADAHRTRIRTSLVMGAHLLAGLGRSLLPLRPSRRRTPRRPCVQIASLECGSRRRTVILRDRSAGGIGMLVFGAPLLGRTGWTVTHNGYTEQYDLCYGARRAPGIWRYGARPASESALEYAPVALATPAAELP